MIFFKRIAIWQNTQKESIFNSIPLFLQYCLYHKEIYCQFTFEISGKRIVIFWWFKNMSIYAILAFLSYILLIFRWTFLISLGFFSLYGVLMIQASSYRMELMMCVLTLFSITMLCYIVADLDSPFSGFFRIDISIIVDVIYRLEVMYKMAAMGFEETVCYPDSSRFTQKKYDDTDSLETSLNVKNVCWVALVVR